MRRFSSIVALVICTVLYSTVRATVVDWSGLTWTPGSLNNSYDIDPGVAGNDVTIAVSGDTAQMQPSLASPNPQTPAITGALEGGLSPAHVNLELALNLSANTQAVTFTLTFSNGYTNGVGNVSFKIFDIDYSNASGNTYQDVIRSITATSATGSTIAPTIVANPNVTLTGTDVNQVLTGNTSTVDTGAGSDAANATITFNATNIRSITFTYGSTTLFTDPTYEHIGIDNISYEILPETNPAWLSVPFCIALAAPSILRRRRARMKPSVER